MARQLLAGYARGIRTSIRSNAAAYGYSVLITGSFGAVSASDGSPNVPELFLFVAGAASAFTGIEAAASNGFRERVRGDPPDVVVLGSAFALIAIGAGLAAAALVGWALGSWLPWFLGSFAATLTYLFVFGVELSLARRAGERQQGGRHTGRAG